MAGYVSLQLLGKIILSQEICSALVCLFFKFGLKFFALFF